MKTEKELKEEIEKLDNENEVGYTNEGLMVKYRELAVLRDKLKTLQERNAEVEQVIEKYFDKWIKKEILPLDKHLPKTIKKELLQKLGLGEE